MDEVESPITQWVDFQDEQSDLICCRVTRADNSVAYSYDHSGDVIAGVEVGEYSGQIVQNESGLTLVWVDSQRMKSISIFATNLSQDKLLQLSESLRY